MDPYMQTALNLAEQGRYTCAPNPMVGCVLVKDNRIVGQGWHQRSGEAHAEIRALAEAGPLARGAIAYVTLEPCNHQGKTGACTEALINAGIETVYAAIQDPNPCVQGRGIAALRAAGISVHLGEGAKQAEVLNEVFFHSIREAEPFVIAKWAMSLDGKISTLPSQSRWITAEDTRQHAHQLRRQVSAILIGAHTAIKDDPQLTVRLNEINIADSEQPWRVILSTQGALPLHLKLFNDAFVSRTLVYTTELISGLQQKQLEDKGVSVCILPVNKEGKVCISSVLADLYRREISSVLVEGGSQILSQFYKAHKIQKIYAYIAPKLIGGTEALSPLMSETLEETVWQRAAVISFESDLCMVIQKKRSYQ